VALPIASAATPGMLLLGITQGNARIAITPAAGLAQFSTTPDLLTVSPAMRAYGQLTTTPGSAHSVIPLPAGALKVED